MIQSRTSPSLVRHAVVPSAGRRLRVAVVAKSLVRAGLTLADAGLVAADAGVGGGVLAVASHLPAAATDRAVGLGQAFLEHLSFGRVGNILVGVRRARSPSASRLPRRR